MPPSTPMHARHAPHNCLHAGMRALHLHPCMHAEGCSNFRSTAPGLPPVERQTWRSDLTASRTPAPILHHPPSFPIPHKCTPLLRCTCLSPPSLAQARPPADTAEAMPDAHHMHPSAPQPPPQHGPVHVDIRPGGYAILTLAKVCGGRGIATDKAMPPSEWV